MIYFPKLKKKKKKKTTCGYVHINGAQFFLNFLIPMRNQDLEFDPIVIVFSIPKIINDSNLAFGGHKSKKKKKIDIKVWNFSSKIYDDPTNEIWNHSFVLSSKYNQRFGS